MITANLGLNLFIIYELTKDLFVGMSVYVIVFLYLIYTYEYFKYLCKKARRGKK